MKNKHSHRVKKKKKIKTKKNNQIGGEQDFSRGHIYIHKGMYCTPKTEEHQSELTPICLSDLTPANDKHREEYRNKLVDYEEVEQMPRDTELFKNINEIYKAEKARQKEGPVAKKLSPGKIRNLKMMLFDAHDKIELPLSLDELTNREQLEKNEKKSNIFVLINKTLEDSQYMYTLCRKMNMLYNQQLLEWFVKNTPELMSLYIKNYPMMLNKKSEKEIMKDILKLGLQKYDHEQKNIQKIQELESLNRDKQYAYDFGLMFNYKLFPPDQILKRCTQLGQIKNIISKEMMTNHQFNYLRLGVHHEQKNILYHCLLEIISEQYYLLTDTNQLNAIISMLKQRIVFNYLNGEDFEIYFQPQNKHIKNYTRDPDYSYQKLQEYVKTFSDNNDYDLPLLCSVLDYNIFVITENSVPLNYPRFCFKNSRRNLVILKTVKDGQNYYEPIVQLTNQRINLSNLLYKQLRNRNVSNGIFDSNHDLILTLISKYILHYSEDSEKFSDCFQNWEISTLYFEQLFSGRYLTEHIRNVIIKNSLCGSSTIFPPDKFSLPVSQGRTYQCNSEHPLLFRIDDGLGGYEDLCCTDNLSANGVGEFITRYNPTTKLFDRVKIPNNKYTTFVNDFNLENKRIMRTIIETGNSITRRELNLILPIFRDDIFNNRFQIRKFISSNIDWTNNMVILYKMAESNVILNLVGDPKNTELRDHFDKFKESWNAFKSENKDFVNESTDSVDYLVKIYSMIFEAKRKEEDKKENKEALKEKEEKEQTLKEKDEEEQKELDSNEISFKVKVGKLILELVRDSVPNNKYAFLNTHQTTISFFLGGKTLESGNYLVLNKNQGSYNKIDISPSSEDLYRELFNNIKNKTEDSGQIFKNIFKFLTNTYKRFQNHEPEEIEELLSIEIQNLMD